MKLIHKTARYYLGYALFIFGLGTVLFYYIIRIVVLASIDEAIHQEKVQLIHNLRYERGIEELRPSPDIEFRKAPPDAVPGEKYSSILVYSKEKEIFIDYRQLVAVFSFEDHLYEVRIRQSMEQAMSLLNGIVLAEAALFVLFLAGVLLMNNYVNKNVWSSFYELLDKIKAYDFEKTKVIPFHASGITEFEELSASMQKMTSKIYRDFLNQKEFNENYAHELQTPLAILRNQLELLVQSKKLGEEEMDILASSFEAINRLKQLSRGLILIAQIDNRQYSELREVRIDELVEQSLKNFQFQMEEKNIRLTECLIEAPCLISSNPILAEILVTNLISNAIRHNYSTGGEIKIQLTRQKLCVENTGTPLNEDAEKMFERFKKNSESNLSIGLGLPIVKKITELLNYSIRYTNTQHWHSLEVTFFSE
jgi:signal transduction histidine kinase